MTRLHIKIKDTKKASIVFDLLKELPFVEIEKTENQKHKKPSKKVSKNLEDLFGLWGNRDISVDNIRGKAWNRNQKS